MRRVPLANMGWDGCLSVKPFQAFTPRSFNSCASSFSGLDWDFGQEFQALRQLVGFAGPALGLYQLFRDPHSAFDTASRQYSFMTIGPVSPLSFAGTPLFFQCIQHSRSLFGSEQL
ncbi:hypothetical protein [Kyrpidia spormannii]|uniref:hypothetical protein n=1 Tax=Kyrpidia spormannii TaxID=2055160 RepID=UPI0018E47679|nr:hypothetical protein [Kyrpidia spormannii]